MDLTSKSTIKKILKKHKVRPSKQLGQYFLISKKVRELIIQTANLTREDTVIEIGPGIGTLTEKLAKIAGKVIAVEKDKRMCQILKETLKDYKNIEIVNQDILTYKIKNLKTYKLVANLPYYITSPVIRKFLEIKFPPKEMALLVQKEVAQRICAKPRHTSPRPRENCETRRGKHGRGKPGRMSILAVAVQFYSKPEIVKIVLKKAFWPVPKVDSAILKITQIHVNAKADSRKFFKVVKAGFSSPRKQLINNLAKGLNLDKEKIREIFKEIKIGPNVRAQELSIKDWMKILEVISRK